MAGVGAGVAVCWCFGRKYWSSQNKGKDGLAIEIIEAESKEKWFHIEMIQIILTLITIVLLKFDLYIICWWLGSRKSHTSRLLIHKHLGELDNWSLLPSGSLLTQFSTTEVPLPTNQGLAQEFFSKTLMGKILLPFFRLWHNYERSWQRDLFLQRGLVNPFLS